MKYFTVSLKRFNTWVTVLVGILIMLASCQKGSLQPELLSGENEIVAVSLKKADGTSFNITDITVTIKEDSIHIIVPADTDRSQLIPGITIKGLSVSPASGTVQNFTAPVRYTVTAEDGSSQTYVVIVDLAPAINNGIVYIGSSDKNFYALDALNGSLKWKYASTNWFVYSSPTFYNGIIYVGGVDSYVYAFDAVSGAVVWKYKAGDIGVESDAVVANGTVYVGSNDDNLYALDAATGNFKWKFTTGGNVSASPCIMNGIIYFGSSDNNLYALDEITGQLKWSYATGAMINQSGPSVVDGVVFVGSRDGFLYAIDAVTGHEKWKYGSGGISLEQSSPTVVNGIVYIGSWYNISNFSLQGSLYAINATTGSLVWEGLKNLAFSSSPFVADNRLYISADDGFFYALDAATGNILWRQYILPNSTSATVSNGIVYVGGGGTRHIYAFDAINGTEKWKFATPNGLSTSAPLIISAAGEANYPGDSGSQQ